MAMPETAMDKDNGTVLWKVKIRLAGKISRVNPVSKT